MSCNHCSTKFNFFHKELGCASCGLSFCSKCLKQKCIIPNKGLAEYNVCKRCYVKLTTETTDSSNSQIIPPDAYLKRLETLGNAGGHNNHSHVAAPQAESSLPDLELVQRLEKLKGDRNKNPPPTLEELQTRLAALKGEKYVRPSPIKMYGLAPAKTEQEESDLLLKQLVRESNIDLLYRPQHDDRAALNEDEDDEAEVAKITERIMDEVKLEENCSTADLQEETHMSSFKDNIGASRSSPELPWCVLCNKDACYQCLDCEDLYCSECNREVHKEWDAADHRVKPYTPK